MLVITFALTGQAQTLNDRLNDAVMFAEKNG
jgi:hypothetical protein